MPDEWKPTILICLMVLGIVTVGGTFGWIGLGIGLKGAGPELKLPLIVIVGVVVLLVTLALVAVTFSILNLSDKGQALALPEGSVRAVIALMLLVVFAIVAIYLYGSVAGSGRVQFIDGVPQAQEAELRKQVNVVAVLPSKPEGAIKVYYKDAGGAGEDIAKQLLVLLGTLVTAVASFYFGSSSVASARDAAERARSGAGGPNATSVDPPTLNAGGKSQPLTITGANLGKVNAVKLLSADGKTSIPADDGSVKASDTSVTCTVTVPANTPAGPLDVVVSDNANNDSTVPKGVSIKGSGDKPDAKTVDPSTLKADGSEQDLKITGTSLGKVTGVKLVAADGKSIEAPKASIKPTDKEVSCKVTIETGTAPGQRDVVVSDDANNKSTVPTKVTITS